MSGSLGAGLASGSIGFLARAVSQLAVLAVTLVATRTLGIAAFGAYAIALAFSFLSRNLLYVGPYEYLLKSPLTPTLAASCLIANAGVALISALAIAGLSTVSETLFHNPDTGWLLLRLAPSFFLVALLSWCEALLLREGRVRRYYAIIVAGELAGAGVGVAGLFAGFGLTALVAQAYVRAGTILLIYLFARGFQLALAGDWREVRVVLGWSWPRYGASLLNFGSAYGADLVLGLLLSPAATGLYRAASRIVTALSDLFAQPLLKIAQANISARRAAGEPPGQGWLAMLGGVAAIAWAALTGLALAAGDIVPFVLGEHWRPAAPLVAVFCFARALTIIDAVTTPLLVASDQQRFMLPVQMLVAVLMLVAALALAPQGPLAVALAAAVIALGMSLIYARRALGLSQGAVFGDFARILVMALTPVLAMLLMAGTAAVLELVLQPWWRLALLALAALVGLVLIRRPLGQSLAALAPRLAA